MRRPYSLELTRRKPLAAAKLRYWNTVVEHYRYSFAFLECIRRSHPLLVQRLWSLFHH